MNYEKLLFIIVCRIEFTETLKDFTQRFHKTVHAHSERAVRFGSKVDFEVAASDMQLFSQFLRLYFGIRMQRAVDSGRLVLTMEGDFDFDGVVHD